jgi:hypothetical protein
MENRYLKKALIAFAAVGVLAGGVGCDKADEAVDLRGVTPIVPKKSKSDWVTKPVEETAEDRNAAPYFTVAGGTEKDTRKSTVRTNGNEICQFNRDKF